ncbi:MAG: DUF2442 domain-containing protein [Acidithiobacillus sp.]
MSVVQNARSHTTVAVSQASWDVVDVSLVAPWVIQVRFSDGVEGRVRMEQSHLIGVFEPLQDLSFFEQVYIDDGAVTWPGEIDLASDAMHDAIQEHGEWVLK